MTPSITQLHKTKCFSDQLDSYSELQHTALQLVDHNELLYVYKREVAIAAGAYVTQYYFRQALDAPLQLLSKEQLIRSYAHCECASELQLFLQQYDSIQLNDYGHLMLFDVINTHAATRAYQVLQYEILQAKQNA